MTRHPRPPGPFSKPPTVFSKGAPVARIKPTRRDAVADRALADLARAMVDLERATDAWLERASEDEAAEAMEMRHRWGLDRGVPQPARDE